QDEAAALGDPAASYRLGLLEACRLIGQIGDRYVGATGDDPFMAVHQCWKEVYDAARYLGDMAYE
ncbi:MAG: hypothetical protein ACO3NK_17090, partial [Prochlorotrichaceae cyanobacterium]